MVSTGSNGAGRRTEAAIEVTALAKTYPSGVEAVRGVDFRVSPGEVFGLLGPNGAGKSTTIGMLTTTVAPSRGTARVAGHDVATAPLAARRASAVVFQEAVVDRTLTGRRNLETHARLWGLDLFTARSRIADVMDAFGLADLLDRPVSSYSGGQRRRLDVALGIVGRPELLFLDEPTTGFDPEARRHFWSLIRSLRDLGTTILLTTHYLDEAERLCDRIAIIHAGQIVALDTPAALLAGLGHELVELRVHGDAATALASLRMHGLAGDDAFTVGSTLTVPLHEHTAPDAIAVIHDADLATSSISTRQPTLDDVYLQLTGARLADAA